MRLVMLGWLYVVAVYFLSLIRCCSLAFFVLRLWWFFLFRTYIYVRLAHCLFAARLVTHSHITTMLLISLFLLYFSQLPRQTIQLHLMYSVRMCTAAAANSVFLSRDPSILIKISKFYTQIIYLFIFSVVFNSVMSLFIRSPPLSRHLFLRPMHNVNRILSI